MTRIKICGITRAEDLRAAVEYGADALGLVFYEASPRNVTVPHAAHLAQSTPPFVNLVGLFVNPSVAEVQTVLRHVPLATLQFHGEETPEFCAQFNKPYLKAIRVKAGVDLLQCASDFSSAQGLLLDAHVEGIQGGTGATFDWTLIPKHMPMPIILSGGLDAKNVVVAIKLVKPYAVDVSSGVEASKGIKDVAKIAAFINEVKYL